MPSKSPAQHRMMEGVAHSPGFAKKVGVPQAVGQEFVQADDKASPEQAQKQMAQATALRKPKGAKPPPPGMP